MRVNKMATILVLAMIMMGTSACDGNVFDVSSQGSDWVRAPENYYCTEDEMVVVDRETESCVKNTEYFGRYCYGTAIMRRCTLKSEDKSNAQSE